MPRTIKGSQPGDTLAVCLLRSARTGEFDLPDLAKAHRIAISELEKVLSDLKDAGFGFLQTSSGQIQLSQSPKRLHAADILSRSHHLQKWSACVYSRTPSTNDLGLQYGATDQPLPHAIFTEQQTSGRGRLGRKWFSNRTSSLCFSAVVRPLLPHDQWHHLAAVAAVAVSRSIEALTPLKAGIKWPNDIMCQGKKLGGILVESVIQNPARSFAVIGIGLNINQSRFPSEIAQRATSLKKQLGFSVDRIALAAKILEHLEICLSEIARDQNPILEEFRHKNIVFGKPLSVIRPDGSRMEGHAESIDATGHLIIRTAEGSLECLSAGEISLSGW